MYGKKESFCLRLADEECRNAEDYTFNYCSKLCSNELKHCFQILVEGFDNFHQTLSFIKVSKITKAGHICVCPALRVANTKIF